MIESKQPYTILTMGCESYRLVSYFRPNTIRRERNESVRIWYFEPEA